MCFDPKSSLSYLYWCVWMWLGPAKRRSITASRCPHSPLRHTAACAAGSGITTPSPTGTTTSCRHRQSTAHRTGIAGPKNGGQIPLIAFAPHRFMCPLLCPALSALFPPTARASALSADTSRFWCDPCAPHHWASESTHFWGVNAKTRLSTAFGVCTILRRAIRGMVHGKGCCTAGFDQIQKQTSDSDSKHHILSI